MSKWGERFKEHYRGLTARVIEVPEMKDADGNQLVIYARPASVRAAQQILDAGSKSMIRAYIEAMVVLGRDKHGEKIFDDSDRLELLDASKDMIERVGLEIIRSCTDIELSAPFKDIVKNSDASPNA